MYTDGWRFRTIKHALFQLETVLLDPLPHLPTFSTASQIYNSRRDGYVGFNDSRTDLESTKSTSSSSFEPSVRRSQCVSDRDTSLDGPTFVQVGTRYLGTSLDVLFPPSNGPGHGSSMLTQICTTMHVPTASAHNILSFRISGVDRQSPIIRTEQHHSYIGHERSYTCP